MTILSRRKKQILAKGGEFDYLNRRLDLFNPDGTTKSNTNNLLNLKTKLPQYNQNLNRTNKISNLDKYQPNIDRAKVKSDFDYFDNKVGKGNKPNLSSLIPYASNISNAFRKLPKPIKSQLERPITPNLVNFDAARAGIDTDTRNLNRETDYKVANPAVAQAIKATILGKSIQGKNNIAQEEGNINAGIKNQTSQFNTLLNARNIERENEFNRENIQRDISQQNLLSDNLADVGDKYQQQKYDKSLMDLENRKLSYLPEFFNKNEGYFQRARERNSDNYDKEFYGAFGGAIGGDEPKKKPISSSDFTLIPWKKQGVLDSTGRAPMYKTTNASLYNLNRQPIPKGVDPNGETYAQIGDLNERLPKPVTSYARDIYGDTATNDQGRLVSDFIRRKFRTGGYLELGGSIGVDDQRKRKEGTAGTMAGNMDEFGAGGTIHIKPSHRGLLHKNLGIKKGSPIPASKLVVHSGDSTALKKRKIFTQNAKKWHH